MGFIVDTGGDAAASVLIAGSGRSGTTWIGEVLAKVARAREIFEPLLCDDDFDIATVKGRKLRYEGLRRDYEIYIPPEMGRRSRYHAPLDRVLTGRLRNRWCDAATPSGVYRRRLIKEIRSNLALAYIARNWSELRIIWVIRDPVDVIRSQIKMSRSFGYTFDFRPINVLFQPRLVADWLADHVRLMQAAETKAERLAHRWCVETMVPLWQGAHTFSNVMLVRYETLVANPDAWREVIRFACGEDADTEAEGLGDIIARPSRTTKSGETGDALGPGEADAIRAIVESYGAGGWLAEAA